MKKHEHKAVTNYDPPAISLHINTINGVVHQFGELVKPRGLVAAGAVSHVSHVSREIKMN